ncbi:hypothetical protein GINT2_001874 [Glugoides intestinalis]
MTERKRVKQEKSLETAKELLEKLKNTPTSEEDQLNECDLKACIESLENKSIRPLAIASIAEIARIMQQTNFLEYSEVEKMFYALLESINTVKLELTEFLNQRLAARLQSHEIIKKFLTNYPKATCNREALREMLAQFIEYTTDRDALIMFITRDSSKYNDLIPLIIGFIDVSRLEEEQYMKLFCSSPFFRENATLRLVRGKLRQRFVAAALEIDRMFVLENYIHDRDKRVRILLATKVCIKDEPFYKMLLCDNEDDVRHALIRRISFEQLQSSPEGEIPLEKGVELIADRLLDKSAKVRLEVFKLYENIMHNFKQSGQAQIFLNHQIDNGKLNFTRKSTTDGILLEPLFMHFFKKLCEGCLTGLPAEYFSAIDKTGLTLDFLSDNRTLPGLSFYLNARSLSDFNAIPSNLQAFCLEYMFKGSLTDFQIKECIKSDVFEVLPFIPDPKQYFDLLLEKALCISNLSAVEDIVQFIKPILVNRPLILKNSMNDQAHSSLLDTNLIDDSGVFIGEIGLKNTTKFSIDNEAFINAHTRLPDLFIDQQTGKFDYPHLYFLVHQRSGDFQTSQSIKDADIPIFLKMRLLCYLDKIEVLDQFADSILSFMHEKTHKRVLFSDRNELLLHKLLIGKKTFTSTMLYFLCTGLVSLTNQAFFIRAIVICSCTKSNSAVMYIFKKYVRAIDQATFDIFYSLCWSLKNYSFKNLVAVNNEDSLILNPVLTDTLKDTGEAQVLNNPENECNMDSSTVTLLEKDKMLYYICNTVIGAREGQLVETVFDPLKYGLYRLSDRHAEMVGEGKVHFEK